MTQGSRRNGPRAVRCLGADETHTPESRAADLVDHVLGDLLGDPTRAAGVVLDVRRGNLRCIVLCEPNAILSPRELEIARMVAQGHPTKRIAHILEISAFTVNSHLRRVFTKLGVSSRPAMVSQLAQHGFVDLTLPIHDLANDGADWDAEPL